MLELVALTSDAEAAAQVAASIGATSYRNHEGESDRRPYSGLIRASTDRIGPLREVADVALATAYARVIKAPTGPPPPGRAIGSFGLVGHPDLTHDEADGHWRDVHGPLALRSHSAMCDYTQLSFVANLHGLALDGLLLDGLALCAFATRTDLSERFFDDDRARAAIEADVATFADPKRSPRRVVLVENDLRPTP